MIQRIQSIFLLLSSVSFFSLFGVPFATSSVSIPSLFSDLVYNVQDSPILMAMVGLGGLISLGAIFLFNNRPLQIKLGYVGTVLSILIPALAILLIYNERTFTEHSDQIHDGFGIFLPILSLIFLILATIFIKKDENTVRSMDRLR